VGCAGRAIPLGAFGTALPGRRVRFVGRMTPAPRPLRALLYEAWRPACGALDDELIRRLRLERGRGPAPGDGPTAPAGPA
jgi:hypothetical protein